MSDDTLASDKPFFEFAQAAQDLLKHQLQAMREEAPDTHAVLVRSPATWRVVMTLAMPGGQVLVTSDCTLPSGECIGLHSAEFQPRALS